MNEAPEGDGSRQAPVVLLAAFRGRLKFLFGLRKFQVSFFLFSCSCSLSSFTAFAHWFMREKRTNSLSTEATYCRHFSLLQKHAMKLSLLANCRNAPYHKQEIHFCKDLSSHISAECFHVLTVFLLYVFMSISVSMCRPTGLSRAETLASTFSCVHVCCWGTSDLRARRTPRLLAGGLSTLGGRADLIFHRSTAPPWTPSLSPHGRTESCSVNTRLKYAACQPPLHHAARSLAGPHN